MVSPGEVVGMQEGNQAGEDYRSFREMMDIKQHFQFGTYHDPCMLIEEEPPPFVNVYDCLQPSIAFPMLSPEFEATDDGTSSGSSCGSDYQWKQQPSSPFPMLSPEFEITEDGNSPVSCGSDTHHRWSDASGALAQLQQRSSSFPMISPEFEATEDCNSSGSCGSWSATEELASLDPIVLQDIPMLFAEHTGYLPGMQDGGLEDQISDSSSLGGALDWMFPSDEAVEDKEEQGVELVQQLLACAQAISAGEVAAAQQHAKRLRHLISSKGSSMERVATYFTEALSAWLGEHHGDSDADAELSTVEEKLMAYQTFYTSCPYLMVSHFTANEAILEAFEGEERVHVVDLDVKQGLQWPSLIQALSERPTGPPRLRITGLAGDTFDLKSLMATKKRLLEFADMFSVPLEVTIITEKLESLQPWALGIRDNEALAVNCVGCLHRLVGNPRLSIDNFLRRVHSMDPSVVTIVEEDADHDQEFLPRFMSALHYYSSMFDSLAASCTSSAQSERETMERLLMGMDIMDIVGRREGQERSVRHQTADFWVRQMQQSGFRLRPMSSRSVLQANCLLSMYPVSKFCLTNEDCYLSVGWQDKPLYSVSSWY